MRKRPRKSLRFVDVPLSFSLFLFLPRVPLDSSSVFSRFLKTKKKKKDQEKERLKQADQAAKDLAFRSGVCGENEEEDDEEYTHTKPKQIRILSRNTLPPQPSPAPSQPPVPPSNTETTPSAAFPSYEERLAQYEKARAAIFSQPD